MKRPETFRSVNVCTHWSASVLFRTLCRKNKVLFSAAPRQQSGKQTGFKVTPDAAAIETIFIEAAGELKLMPPQTWREPSEPSALRCPLNCWDLWCDFSPTARNLHSSAHRARRLCLPFVGDLSCLKGRPEQLDDAIRGSDNERRISASGVFFLMARTLLSPIWRNSLHIVIRHKADSSERSHSFFSLTNKGSVFASLS